jgi:ADP-heptose:LPS heptosyltransferase
MTPANPPFPKNIPVRVFNPPAARGKKRTKIVLLKLDHIGDFIVALDAFGILRRAFPDADITLICLPSVVSLAKSTKLFDKVKGFDGIPDSAQLGKTPKINDAERLRRFKALLDEPYFLAADFRHDPFNRFGLDHIEAEYRAAFIAQTEKGLDIVVPLMEWETPFGAVGSGKNLPLHAGVRLNLLAHAIVETLLEKPPNPDLFQPPKDAASAKTYAALKAEKRMKIGLSVGAGAEVRKWNSDFWGKLLPVLAKKQDAFFVFFGSSEDKAETQILKAALGDGNAMDLTGVLALDHAPGVLNLIDAYIGCDTGLTHLAASLGVPTINIFGGISNISVWRARGTRVKTLYAVAPCAPCHKRFKKACPHGNLCMNAISPGIVAACFEELKKACSFKS